MEKIYNYPINLHNPIRYIQMSLIILCLFGSIFDSFTVFKKELFSPFLKNLIGAIFLVCILRDLIGSHFNQPIRWKTWVIISTFGAGCFAFCVGLLFLKMSVSTNVAYRMTIYCIIFNLLTSLSFLHDTYYIIRLLRKMDLGSWVPPLAKIKIKLEPQPKQTKKKKAHKILKAKKPAAKKTVTKEQPSPKPDKKKKKKKKKKKVVPRLEVRTLDGFTFYKDPQGHVFNSKGMHMKIKHGQRGKIFLLDGTRLTRCQMPNETLFCRDKEGNVYNNDGVPLKCIIENGIIVGLDGATLTEEITATGRKRYKNENGLVYCCPEQKQIHLERTRSARRRAEKAEADAERAKLEASKSEAIRLQEEQLAEQKREVDAAIAKAEAEFREAEAKALAEKVESERIAQAELDRIAKAESDRIAREKNERAESERIIREENDRIAETESARIAQQERDRSAREVDRVFSSMRRQKPDKTSSKPRPLTAGQAEEYDRKDQEGRGRQRYSRDYSDYESEKQIIDSSGVLPRIPSQDHRSRELQQLQLETEPRYGRFHLREEKGPGLISIQEETYTVERKIEQIDGRPHRKVSREKYRAKVTDDRYITQQCPMICPRVIPQEPVQTPQCPKTCPQIPVIPKPSSERVIAVPSSSSRGTQKVTRERQPHSGEVLEIFVPQNVKQESHTEYPEGCRTKERQRDVAESAQCSTCRKRKVATRDGCVCENQAKQEVKQDKPIEYTTGFEQISPTGHRHVITQTRVRVENVSRKKSDNDDSQTETDENCSNRKPSRKSRVSESPMSTKDESPRQPPTKKKA